jgi:hypothetical protein
MDCEFQWFYEIKSSYHFPYIIFVGSLQVLCTCKDLYLLNCKTEFLCGNHVLKVDVFFYRNWLVSLYYDSVWLGRQEVLALKILLALICAFRLSKPVLGNLCSGTKIAQKLSFPVKICHLPPEWKSGTFHVQYCRWILFIKKEQLYSMYFRHVAHTCT